MNQFVSQLKATTPPTEFAIPPAATVTNALLGDSLREAFQTLVVFENGDLLPCSSDPNLGAGHSNRLAMRLEDEQAAAIATIARRWHRKMAATIAQAPAEERGQIEDYQRLLVREWQQAITRRTHFIDHMDMVGRPYKLFSPRVDLDDPATWEPAYVQFSAAFFRIYADQVYWWADLDSGK